MLYNHLYSAHIIARYIIKSYIFLLYIKNFANNNLMKVACDTATALNIKDCGY